MGGVIAAGVYWIHLELIYNIAFRQGKGMFIEEATQSNFFSRKRRESRLYRLQGLKLGINEEIDECTENCILNVAVHIDGETQLRSNTRVSDDEHYLSRRKKMKKDLF